MPVNNLKYKLSIIVFALSTIVLLVAFKINVAGWKEVPVQKKQKVLKYDLMKRSNDLTISSLKQSCVDFEALSQKLKAELLQSNLQNLSALKEELLRVPDDSILLVLSKKVYYMGDYYEKESEKGKRIVNLYNLNCGVSVIFIFEKSYNNDFKMTDVKNLPDFFDCVYTNDFE
jgi:hypothetical protein